jgi:RNA polymerase sigma-70 factor (ECF subfamily)
MAIAAREGAGHSVKAVDEQALIRQAQAGNRAAFEELVRHYDRDVLRLAMNIMRQPEDARDIYQEAFLKVYKNLHRFRFECSFYTWVYRVVTNVCLDHLRRRSSRREDQAPEPAGLDGNDAAAGADFFDRQAEPRAEANPERRLMGKEIGEQIDAALSQLSPRERVVFELKHYHGLKLRVIGEMLGTSEETVKNSLFRATQKLRARLEGLR